MQQERRTITVEQAAEILGISRGSAYALANSGELPVIRMGRRLLVPKAALYRLLGMGAGEAPAKEEDPARASAS
ncbi:MAG TPA: helix-turn-helix domain-containing protein [Stellaceae bacterium]|nr:helix-turn-helix domain-containing protein [Stellaceae bacterium]